MTNLISSLCKQNNANFESICTSLILNNFDPNAITQFINNFVSIQALNNLCNMNNTLSTFICNANLIQVSIFYSKH